MFKILGEVYTFDIQHNKIEISSEYSGMEHVLITASEQEDFSIFDLGPAIARDITMSCENMYVGKYNYPHGTFRILQNPGKSVLVELRVPRANPTDPIDSGRIFLTIKDYVKKYE